MAEFSIVPHPASVRGAARALTPEFESMLYKRYDPDEVREWLESEKKDGQNQDPENQSPSEPDTDGKKKKDNKRKTDGPVVVRIRNEQDLEQARQDVERNNKGYVQRLYVLRDDGKSYRPPSILDLYRPVELRLLSGWWG